MQTVTRLMNAAAALKQINSEVESLLVEVRKGTLPEACRSFKALRDAYEAVDEPRKAIYAQVESMSRGTIPEMMEEADVTNITIEIDGVKTRFTKSNKVSCSMPDKEGGMEWLRKNGGGGIIIETVNASTLSSFAKDFVKEHGKDLPPEFFRMSSMAFTSVAKA